MGGEQALERSVLERKERDELHTIAEALGVKPGTRTKKADLIQTILVAAGVEPASAESNGEEKPERATRARKAVADSNGEADAAPTPVGEAASPDPAPPAAVPAEGESTNGKASGDGLVGGGPTQGAHDGTGLGSAVEATEGAGQGLGGQVRSPGDGGGHPRQSGGQQGGGGQRQGGQGGQGGQPRQQGGQGGGGQQARREGGQGGQGGDRQPGNFDDGGSRRSRRRRGRDKTNDRDFRVQEQTAEQQYQGELVPVSGLLDLSDQGYGYVRTKSYLPTAKDVYVSTSQAKRFALRKGDSVEGEARPPMGNEKYGALLRIDKISGMSVEEARNRRRFEDLTPLFPDEKLKMEQPGEPGLITARIIDIISPIGKGQRGLIVSPPKAGKTTVIKQIASSIESNNPDVHLMVLLVDERPEEVTDMRRHVKGEVVASTFDRPSDEHTLVAELAIERAKRLVELGKDVVIILDGITRLARAYNLSAPASGRLTSGGIDQAAIYPPKKFFGAARNIEEGGSLTILATALVETGSKADDVIFEEFKGTGNMELRLDRRLAERRIYPAIDVNASSTRHEELLFERKQLDLVWRLRRVLNGLAEDGTSARSLELLIEKLKTTKNNDEFLAEVAKAQGASI
ncbi:MAG: transcription termination factor Rho [Actinomycetota bacterium]|nr:transcription termination factor Rho [Actinomycetota bacterium]